VIPRLASFFSFKEIFAYASSNLSCFFAALPPHFDLSGVLLFPSALSRPFFGFPLFWRFRLSPSSHLFFLGLFFPRVVLWALSLEALRVVGWWFFCLTMTPSPSQSSPPPGVFLVFVRWFVGVFGGGFFLVADFFSGLEGTFFFSLFFFVVLDDCQAKFTNLKPPSGTPFRTPPSTPTPTPSPPRNDRGRFFFLIQSRHLFPIPTRLKLRALVCLHLHSSPRNSATSPSKDARALPTSPLLPDHSASCPSEASFFSPSSAWSLVGSTSPQDAINPPPCLRPTSFF